MQYVSAAANATQRAIIKLSNAAVQCRATPPGTVAGAKRQCGGTANATQRASLELEQRGSPTQRRGSQRVALRFVHTMLQSEIVIERRGGGQTGRRRKGMHRGKTGAAEIVGTPIAHLVRSIGP